MLGAIWLLCTSCLDDLPEATSCPPKADRKATDCITGLDIMGPGCFDHTQVQCLAGKRSSCACQSDECPDDADACYPTGDCPPNVAERVGEDAECFRLSGSDIQGGVLTPAQCVCGCTSCAAACDGKGMVLGMFLSPKPPGEEQEVGFPVVVDIRDMMPKSGRIGVYVRARGVSQMGLFVANADLGEADAIRASYQLESSINTGEFSEQILFDIPIAELPAYEWKARADAPTHLWLFHEPSDTEVTLMEIDCIVPFVVPS